MADRRQTTNPQEHIRQTAQGGSQSAAGPQMRPDDFSRKRPNKLEAKSPWHIALGKMVKNKAAMMGLGILAVLAMLALLAPQISPYDPNQVDMPHQLKRPAPSHPLGTDLYGRDILSRILWGGRVTLVVGLISVAIAASIGIVLGLVSGYYGGAIDTAIMRFVDILLSFPRILLALTVVGMLGTGLLNVMVAVGIAGITGYARLVRGTVQSAKKQAYVEAAQAVGCQDVQILFRHILPNVIGPVIVLATLDVASAILAASSLSFLGLGVQPPTAEWGYMLNEGRAYLRSAPWITFFPGIAIMISVLSINMVGDGLRDALDPKLEL
jgi:peptide/nickel transport system permease protein